MIVFLTYFTINCVVLQLEKKYINFIMTCSHFSLKKTEVRLQTDTFSYFFFFFQKIIKSIKNLFSNIVPSDISTDILSFFFQKIIKRIKNLFSNIVPSSMAKWEERKRLPTTWPCQIFSSQNCVFYQMEIRRTVLKQPIRIKYLIKQKPGGTLALQVNRITDRRVS